MLTSSYQYIIPPFLRIKHTRIRKQLKKSNNTKELIEKRKEEDSSMKEMKHGHFYSLISTN